MMIDRGAHAIRFVERDPAPGLVELVGPMLASSRRGAMADLPSANLANGDNWLPLWTQLRHHRIEGFLPAAVSDGAIRLSPEQQQVLTERARTIALSQLRLRRALADLHDLLEAEGIELRVLKGLATGPLDHRSSAARRTSDVDVLVRPKDFDRACAVILRSGTIELKGGLPAHLLVERTFRTPDGVALDVHHRLFRFGRDVGDELFSDPDSLSDGQLTALPAHARLVHAAAHLLVSPPGHRQMSSLFDVAVLAPVVDMGETERLADRFGVRDVVRFAIWIGDALINPDQQRVRPGVANTLINRAHLRTRRRADLEALAVLREADGLHARFRLVRHQLAQARRRRA